MHHPKAQSQAGYLRHYGLGVKCPATHIAGMVIFQSNRFSLYREAIAERPWRDGVNQNYRCRSEAV